MVRSVPVVDPELQVEGLPSLTGKLDYAGRRRAEDLGCIGGPTLRYALAEREQQIANLIEEKKHD